MAAPPAMRNGYEVVLFFTMLLEGPRGEHLEALEQISAARQGVVVLHHSILAFPYSAFWRRWTDLNDLSHSVDPPEPITTEIAAPDHPITSGLVDWEMVDEIYRMGGPSADSKILLATRHPHSIARAGVGPRERRPAGGVLSGGSRSPGLDPPQLPHDDRALDPVVRRPHLSPQRAGWGVAYAYRACIIWRLGEVPAPRSRGCDRSPPPAPRPSSIRVRWSVVWRLYAGSR